MYQMWEIFELLDLRAQGMYLKWWESTAHVAASPIVPACWSERRWTQTMGSDLRYTLFYATEPPSWPGTVPVRLLLTSSAAPQSRTQRDLPLFTHLPRNRSVRLKSVGWNVLGFYFILGVCAFQGCVSIKVGNNDWSLTVFDLLCFVKPPMADANTPRQVPWTLGKVCWLPAHVDSTAAAGSVVTRVYLLRLPADYLVLKRQTFLESRNLYCSFTVTRKPLCYLKEVKRPSVFLLRSSGVVYIKLLFRNMAKKKNCVYKLFKSLSLRWTT